ncbi:MAG: hypothetical protein JW757_04080 [Anaerolineales bacterium]|nr:hypothetical protein [Anaerolineales bacterium]
MESGRIRIGFIIAILGVLVLIAAGVVYYFINMREPAISNDPDASPPLVNDSSSDSVISSVDVADGIGGGDEPDSDQDFIISLSDGRAQDQEAPPITLAETTPLTEEALAAIMARLPELVTDPADQVDFKLPADPIPPPLTGETIELTFPIEPEEVSAPQTGYGALEVLRYAPEGEVPIAPTINITFNQPMVPLATLAQLSKIDVPVEVTPDLPGTWSWVGTRTLRFNFDSTQIDRLPMATVFDLNIPAGTTSVSGETLAQGVRWQFKTPPPTLTQSYPNHGPQGLEPIIFALFDQRIDPQAVLPYLRTTADNDPFLVTLLDEDEYSEDETISRLVENAPEGRWMVFKPVNPLPKDSYIDIMFAAGMPSAEGPLTTTFPQNFGFNTYPPLKIVEHGCSWYSDNEKCYPLSPWYIRFNNPLDAEKFEEGMVTIDPVLPGAVINISGNSLIIKGASVGNTTHNVIVAAGITDTFGQTLGRNEKLTFKVGKAEPVLFGPEEALVTLDPSNTKPTLSLYVINHDELELQIYQVDPVDWFDFLLYVQDYYRTDQPVSPPGKLVLDERIKVDAPDNTLTEVGIDLSQVMEGSYGHYFVKVKPPKGFFEEDRYWEQINVWVQVTQIGLDVFSDQDEIITWSTALKDGAPLKDVSILSDKGQVLATSGADGLAKIELGNETQYLVAAKGEDSTILPRSTYLWGGGGWQLDPIRDNLIWYVFDDRGMYRPGEEVHLKGWMRLINNSPTGDVELVQGQVEQLFYTVYGSQGNEIASGSADVNALGGFDFNFTLPENVNLGYANIQLSASGSLSGVDNTSFNHSFQIQEFRRPEFEVTARNETTGPYFIDDEAIVAVEAAYYAGGPLPNAETNWLVTSSPTNYSPPNWPDFTFGTWVPWWVHYRFYDIGWGGYESSYYYESFNGRTDATGNHYLKMTFQNRGEPRPYSVNAEASVEDVNRQVWAGATSLLVHPADLYVGMRTSTYYVDRNTPIHVDLIVTDLDGNAIPDRELQVQAARLEWKNVKGEWQEVPVEIQECRISTQEEPVTCTFETPIGGRYQITALVTDDQDRQNQSQITRWVSGGDLPPSREVEKEQVTLIPDKENYQPGDTARILVQSPFSPAEGLLTVTRSGILYTQRFKIEESTTTLQIPITEAHYPNLNIQVDLTGAAPRTTELGEVVEGAPPRPAYASGELNLDIPPLGRTLSLEVTPRETELAPGESTLLAITVKDASGEPVSDAELAVIVVDEAILALTNYQLADPISIFYYARPTNLSSRYSRSSIILVDPAILAAQSGEIANQVMATQTLSKDERAFGAVMEDSMDMAAAPMAAEPAMEEAEGMGMGGAGEAPSPIAIRTNFNPLAVFAPEVSTNANGQATIRVSLPDNLTRYRIMVVAVDEGGKQFGTGESSLTARLPLMVRPSASRFLNFGDQFEMPVVLQNQTDEDISVDVVAQAGNLSLTGDPGYQVTVPANDRVEVRFPGTTISAGTAQVQFAAVSGDYADAAQVSLPVYTPATTEAFATYGAVDEGAVLQPLAPPEGVIPNYGGLEITTSSTALQALTDAVLYLVSYPFDCSEQIASRILAVASLRDVLSAFEADGLPSPEELDAAVERDLAELAKLQNWDGGFPYWRRGQDSIPFNTVHVALALQRARWMGYQVPDEVWYGAQDYLQNIEEYYPSWYSEKIKQTISAYALYVRQEMDDPDPDKAAALLDDAGVEEISLEGLAWIWQVLTRSSGYDSTLEQIRRHVGNQVVETPGAANFITSYDDNAYVLLHSNRRTDAVLLDAIISDNPRSDLIVKVVNGLLAHRKQGHWNNTQENVFVLLALDRYFKTFENVEPDFVARMWLGADYIGESSFEGYTTDSYQLDIPMSFLLESFQGEDSQDIILQKDGAGRLYYRLGLRYAPDDYQLPPIDMGFVVQREYEAVDDPEDVWQDEDGIWHFKAGARVRVKVTMVADNRRYHVALVDHLPAGLEIINPALAVSETVPEDPSAREESFWWWYWTWYQHQNMRDERVEAFTTLLWDGVYEYTYEARATMPGTFIVPPAKAEEMYSPEVFGRSASDIVIID